MTKVFIENFPEQSHWIVSWAPIIIALLALIVSLLSLRWAISQFRASSRPYVWAMNFATLNEQQLLVNQLSTVAIKVSNSPAKIKSISYEYCYLANGEKKTLYSYLDNGRVLFPDGASQFTHVYAELEDERNKLSSDLHICRDVKIEYSSLSGKGSYSYSNSSKLLPGKIQWELENEVST